MIKMGMKRNSHPFKELSTPHFVTNPLPIDSLSKTSDRLEVSAPLSLFMKTYHNGYFDMEIWARIVKIVKHRCLRYTLMTGKTFELNAFRSYIITIKVGKPLMILNIVLLSFIEEHDVVTQSFSYKVTTVGISKLKIWYGVCIHALSC